jgi:hypothetical protein
MRRSPPAVRAELGRTSAAQATASGVGGGILGVIEVLPARELPGTHGRGLNFLWP